MRGIIFGEGNRHEMTNYTNHRQDLNRKSGKITNIDQK